MFPEGPFLICRRCSALGRVIMLSVVCNCCFFCLQLPSFNELRLVSLLGALMSLAYCTIAVVMSATGHPGSSVNYTPAAVPRTTTERLMGIFNALTTIFFAYGAPLQLLQGSCEHLTEVWHGMTNEL